MASRCGQSLRLPHPDPHTPNTLSSTFPLPPTLANHLPGRGDSLRVSALLAATSRPLPSLEGVEPTVLYPRRDDVSKLNTDRLRMLNPATARVYEAM